MYLKRQSKWAKDNPSKARKLIVLFRFFSLVNAILIGLQLYINNVSIPHRLIFGGCYLFLIAVIVYPIKGQKTGLYKHSYWRQKLMDFLLYLSYVFIVAALTNQFAFSTIRTNLESAPEAQLIVNRSNSQALTKKEKKKQFKAWKQKIKSKLVILKKQWKNPETTGQQVAKSMVTIFIYGFAIFLGFYVTAWSCSLSCSGADGAALIVFVLGWGSLLALARAAVKSLNKNKQAEVKVTAPD